MALAPTAALRAQSPSGGESKTRYVTAEAAAAIYLRPQQLLTSPNLEMLPTEVASAAGKQFAGIDPVDIVEVTAVIEPPMQGPPGYAVVLHMAKPVDVMALPEQLRSHTEATEVNGRPYLKSNDPMAPSIYLPDDQTLVFATRSMLGKLFANRGAESASSPLIDRIERHTSQDDLYVAVDIASLQPLIQMGLAQAGGNVPPEAQDLLTAPQHIGAAELAVNLSNPAPSQLLVHANSAQDADRLEGLIDKAIVMSQAKMLEGSAQLSASDDPIEQAMGRYVERISSKVFEPYRPEREGETFVAFDATLDVNSPGGQLASMYVIGVLVALLLPAVQAAREAARRTMSTNNLKMLMLALLNNEGARGSFPAHAIYSDQGQPLLSWRVHILPFIEGQQIYDQFRLDEPWDSEHNKQLISQMPEVYLSPNSKNDLSDGKSNYVAPVGDGLVFDGTNQGTKIRDIRDGTSNTVMLLEVSDEQAVIWTKPDDWEYDAQTPLKGLGGMRPGAFLAAFVDGHVATISQTIDPQAFKAMLTKSGGEVVDSP